LFVCARVGVQVSSHLQRLAVVHAKIAALADNAEKPPEPASLARARESAVNVETKFAELHAEAPRRDTATAGSSGISHENTAKFDALVTFAESAVTNAQWMADEKVRTLTTAVRRLCGVYRSVTLCVRGVRRCGAPQAADAAEALRILQAQREAELQRLAAKDAARRSRLEMVEGLMARLARVREAVGTCRPQPECAVVLQMVEAAEGKRPAEVAYEALDSQGVPYGGADLKDISDEAVPAFAEAVVSAEHALQALLQVLCCAVLCCAVLCCAVLCCAVLCCAVLCCDVLCCVVLCCVLFC
jgi:hypothetical protein